MCNGPHLINITAADDTQPVYSMAPGCTFAELSPEEQALVFDSAQYLKEKEAARNAWLLSLARQDFQRLWDLPDMPEQAKDILREWVCPEEYDEEEEEM